MFVDDLHIISNSIDGLIAIIESLTEDCSKQGIIINLDKSKILLSKEQETQNEELLNNHPILKLFEKHNTGVYLGAHIQPGSPNTYAHIQKRMAKAHSAISAMNLRGLTIGRKTINKIVTSIIIPILTYGLESFPMSDLNYNYLDSFVSKTLHNTWSADQPDQNNNESPLTHWRIYEHDITPPSLIIKRNKININIPEVHQQSRRAQRSYHKILQIELSTHRDTKEWNFNANELNNKYKGTKLIPKQQISDLLNQAIDDHNDQFLENTNWNQKTEGQNPSRITLSMNKPHNNIMKLRERAILSLTTHTCSMCKGIFRSHFQHELNECAHPLRQNSRDHLWNSIEKHNLDLFAFLKTLTSTPIHKSHGRTHTNRIRGNKRVPTEANKRDLLLTHTESKMSGGAICQEKRSANPSGKHIEPTCHVPAIALAMLS